MRSKSKFSFSYVAMALVAIFAIWVYVHEFKGGQEAEKQKTEASALMPFSNDKVVSFHLKARTPGAATNSVPNETVVKKDGDAWKVEKPYADLADAIAVDSFLAAASGEKIGEIVVEAGDIGWKTYGLDAPSAEGEIIAKVDGVEKKRTLQIGSVPAFDSSVYARIDNSNRVNLMSSTALAVLQKDARDFRDKRFFPEATHPEFKDLEIVRAAAPKLHFVLKDSVWTDAAATVGDWPLDQTAVKSYVQSVANLRGNDVWADNKGDAKVIKLRKLDRPGLAITLKADTGEPYTVKIAALEKTEQVAAGVGSMRPLVFSVFKNAIESLSGSIDTFRDLKFPFQFKLADVQAIELERPPGEVSLPMLVHKDGKWLIDPMDPHFQKRDVKPAMVEKLLTDLEALKGKGVVAKGAAKPKLGTKGSLRVGLFADKNRKLVEFVFEPNGEKLFVSSSKIPDRVFELEKTAFDGLNFDIVVEAPAPTPPPNMSLAVPSPTPAPKGTP